MVFRILEQEPEVSIELEWGRPSMTYGELLGYRLRYGVKETELREELLKETSHRIKNLGRRFLNILGLLNLLYYVFLSY